MLTCMCAAVAAGVLYFLFFAPVAGARQPLPVTDIGPERLQKYLEAQEKHQIPWYVFAGIDYAELGEQPDVPSPGRMAGIAARVSGTKQGNVFVSRKEDEFEYATLKKILERYPREDNQFIERAVDRMRSLSRLSRVLNAYGFPLDPAKAEYSDEMDLHVDQPPGHIGVAIYAPEDALVVAASGGTVVFCGRDDAAGNTVSVLGNDGIKTTYAHLGAIRERLREGALVRKGESLGTIGSTGGFAPHLLFCMEDGAFIVNPKVFLAYWRDRD